MGEVKKVTDIDSLLGEIVIVSTPEGEAPEKVRKAWVGVRLPCLYVANPGDPEFMSFGVLDGQGVEPSVVYVVLQSLAINELVRIDSEETDLAVKWWAENGYPKPGKSMFSFRREEARVIKPVLSRESFYEKIAELERA